MSTPASAGSPDRRPAASGTSRRTVAVTSDASGLRQQGCRRLSVVRPLLFDRAAAIHELGGPPARPLLVNNAEDAQRLCTRLRHPQADTGAVYLALMNPTRAMAIQHHLGKTSGPPVLSDYDATATAITAAALTTVARAGGTPATSRIVLAGADRLFVLGPLMMAAGFADITFWQEVDAPRFPLGSIAQDADIVVDLAGCVAGQLAADRCAPTTITPDELGYPILALPGLLRALVDVPDPRVDVDVYLAAAGALVAATPPDRMLPVPEPELTGSVAWAVTQALRHPRERP